MRLVLAKPEDTHHQRNHNQATAQADQASEEAGDKPDDETDNIIFHRQSSLKSPSVLFKKGGLKKFNP
jgi:hypothetical protein